MAFRISQHSLRLSAQCEPGLPFVAPDEVVRIATRRIRNKKTVAIIRGRNEREDDF